jgi:hypothetical protein
MNEYKIKYRNSLYYSDTDSIFLDKELCESEIGTGLGKWKLEYDFKDSVFIAPKVYGGKFAKPIILKKGKKKKEIVKIKGYVSMKSTFNQLQGLLDTSKNPSLNLIQTK